MSEARDLLPVASGRATWAAMRRLARPHRRLVVGGTLVLLGATTAALALPLLLGAVVDVVVEQRPAGDLDGLVVALVVATIAQGTLFGFGSWAVGRLGELLLADLREQVVDRALAVPLDDVERAGTGDLVARACGDVDAVAEAMREAIPEIVASSLIIALTVVGLATLDWRLALAGLAALPIQAGAARWYLRRSRPLYAAERAAEGARSQQLHASVTGARTIRALRLQDAHMATITATSRRAVDLAVSAAAIRARFFSALNAAELVGLGTVLAVSYPLVQSDAITVGGATAAALYFYRLFDPIGALLSQLDTAQSAGAALARLIGVASLPAPPPASATVSATVGAGVGRPGAGADAHGTSEGAGIGSAADARWASHDASGDGPSGGGGGPGLPEVRLRAVTFSYDGGRPALEGVDLVVRPGERVALVGPSGAGKSTVAKLVAGVHRATAGVVEVGGHDVTPPPTVAAADGSQEPGPERVTEPAAGVHQAAAGVVEVGGHDVPTTPTVAAADGSQEPERVAEPAAGVHQAAAGVVEVGRHDIPATPTVAAAGASQRPGSAWAAERLPGVCRRSADAGEAGGQDVTATPTEEPQEPGSARVAEPAAGVPGTSAGGGEVGGRGMGAAGASARGHGEQGRARVGLVTQEVHVFAGPLAADLRLARPEASEDELRAALDRVGATGWVAALDDGLDTVVGESGHQLSPTQAQQLALARLLLADPPVAILDEATAEAGSAGAGELEAAAEAVVAGRTSLVIAHRLTQAAAADRIVVLDQGRVVEQGTHVELLAGGGLYATLWSAWSTAAAPANAR